MPPGVLIEPLPLDPILVLVELVLLLTYNAPVIVPPLNTDAVVNAAPLSVILPVMFNAPVNPSPPVTTKPPLSDVVDAELVDKILTGTPATAPRRVTVSKLLVALIVTVPVALPTTEVPLAKISMSLPASINLTPVFLIL
jgi:hypothetical protein